MDNKTEIFINKARQVHGNKYIYDKVEYICRDSKVCIICPEHGEFWQSPHNHLKGCGCPKCSGMYKPTTEEWIVKAKSIHGEKYDYSKVSYVDNKTKVCIICPKHGEFWQYPNNHLKGEGCKKCRDEEFSQKRKMTTEEFIRRAMQVHEGKYDYSKVDYINNNTKICIICPEHGEFWQTPANHLNGQGCPKCARKSKKIIVDEKHIEKKNYGQLYLEKYREIYGDKYDYSKFVYINNKTKSCIICPEHGEFYKTPQKHLYQGCPECKKEELKARLNSKKDWFVNKANEVHNFRYDYTNTNYNGTQNKISIVCHKKDADGNEHGVFIQNANSHLNGCGCPKCAQESRIQKQTKTTEKFIEKAKELFPNYDYNESVYINNLTPIKIICHNTYKNGEEHGPFYVSPNKFLSRGTSCPHCSKFTSKPELEIFDFIKNLVGEDKVEWHNRKILEGEELDIYIPESKLAIEFDGIFWHCENHVSHQAHLDKTKKCEEQGIHLLHIFSDEYFNNKEIVQERIKHILHKENNKEHIMGRKCNIREIKWEDAKYFLNLNHIQGAAVSTIYLGAFFNDKLVAVMTFVQEKKGMYNLNRFASDYHYCCQGIGSKLFSYFIKQYNPIEVKSFADRRWTSINGNNFYTRIGFIQDSIIPPDYRYVNKNKPSLGRIHKFNFRKQTLHRKYNFQLTMTESEMTKELGYLKIYDCGLIKYVWKKEK